jgi:hypothetical protein
MPIDRDRARQCLRAFDFRKLFIEELGWDKFSAKLVKQIDDIEYAFHAVAEKRGVVVLVADSIPDYAVRVKLDKLIAKDHFEHLIVFTDKPHGRQKWQWVRKEPGKPTAVRSYDFSSSTASGQTAELLLQKLDNLVFTLEEEESIRTGTVTGRLRAFDVEKVTKKFYERFKTEHASFLAFIKGIPDKQMESWYASVMINRLMFLYFIQEKGFLNGDPNYLRNKLAESSDRKTNAYYAEFLSPLFFQGFARKKADRSAATNKLLGEIPYLNGGLFQKHQIEELHGKTIVIVDKAFEKLFDFFKEYNWHLDEREDHSDREINPDVLGYIFEKYINRKQMGAYYTKEDITEYISQNTIIPFLLDEARKGCAVAFTPEGSVWRLLRDDPDRYIHDAMKKGARDTDPPLPPEIEAGVDDVAQRSGWNKTAPEEYALPTEIWREAIDRHQRYRAVKAKLGAGEVHEVNDLITLNLNIRQFAQDVIQFCEGPELLRAIWKAIEKVSVLDPTCGSGAFLFAALNILKPLYEACLIRMQGFIEDNDTVRPKTQEETIRELLKLGESSSLEFKSTARWNVKEDKADKAIQQVIVKTVAAFLNAQGGDLLIGVQDDGSISGIEVDQQLWGSEKRNRDTYENWLTTLLLDACGKQHLANVSISFARLEGKDVCRVTLLASATPVYVKVENQDTFYVRAGNATHALPVKEAVAYHQQRFTNFSRPPIEPEKSQTFKKYSDFRKVFEESKRHPKQDYFILKAIIVNNLFGVDIMEEAVEICKLRLFLKLVAQVDSQDRIEPLPDIDFNIRAGNTLIGYQKLTDIRPRGIRTDEENELLGNIEDEALVVDSKLRIFRVQQTELNGTVTAEDKIKLRKQIEVLEAKLNDYLSGNYGVKKDKVDAWIKSHKPFHWHCDFHSITKTGGFDVIIGNPPYLEKSKFKQPLPKEKLETLGCPDIYAWVFERVLNLRKIDGRLGLIVPVSVAAAESFKPLRTLLFDQDSDLWMSHFANRPGQLFTGAQNRLSIILMGGHNAKRKIYSTRYHRWDAKRGERQGLLDKMRFADVTNVVPLLENTVPKVADLLGLKILEKLSSNQPLGRSLTRTSNIEVLWVRVPGYFCQFHLKPPMVRPVDGGAERPRGELLRIRVPDQLTQKTSHAALNSSTFYLYFCITTDGRHINPSDVTLFPFDPQSMASTLSGEMAGVSDEIVRSFEEHTSQVRKSGLLIDSVAVAKTKDTLDTADDILARHYNFSQSELDYIQNYDIKHRLGADEPDGDED